MNYVRVVTVVRVSGYVYATIGESISKMGEWGGGLGCVT